MINNELKIVIGHKPCVYDIPSDWYTITTDPDNKKDFYVEDDYIWTKNGDADALGDFSYLIPLAKKLKSMPEIQTIRLAQYRKVVCNSKLLNLVYRINSNFYILTRKDLKLYNFNKVTSPLQSDFLLPPFFIVNSNLEKTYQFETILHHYKTCHHIEDLLLFIKDAILCDAITINDADAILHSNKFLIGGIGLGVFPKDLFINIIEQTEKVLNVYYKNSWIKRNDSYQYRSINFLLEIFTSYLILQELKKRDINIPKVLGYLMVIDENYQYQTGKNKT